MKEQDIRQLIEERLKNIEGEIPFDTFSDLTGLSLGFNIDPEVLCTVLQNILKEKNLTVGPQSSTRGKQWSGSEKSHGFSSNKPGLLYEPMSKEAFTKGDHVKIKPTTWRSEVEGVILSVNRDKTVNVGDLEAKNVYENVPLEELDAPLAKGRPVAPPQYKRRMNDVDWWGPSDIGDNNFKREYPGCLTGDTKIPLLDGTYPTLEELYLQKKKDFFVYSMNEDKKEVRCGLAKEVILTKKAVPILKIVLDNAESFRCTPEHLILLRDGTYCRADNLTINSSLMPLYRRLDNHGYERVRNPGEGKEKLTHRVAAIYKCGDIKGWTIHHKVISIENDGYADVYDIVGVESYHNFALASGIFVHNSYFLPKGQEGQSVVNPFNPFYKSAASMYDTTIVVTANKIDWDEIKAIAEQIRGQFVEDHKVSPRGFCEKTSKYLANVLKNNFHLDATPIFGYVSDIKGRMLAHWWVEVEDKVIDVTGDQFGKDADLHAVYVGPLPDNYIEAVPYA